MTRYLVRAIVGAVLAVVVIVGVSVVTHQGSPDPASADSYPSNCLAMTDSIARLYQAYFGRLPDPSGFNHWVSEYSTGDMSLEEISDAFARSPELATRGLTTNQAFVDWLYRDVLGPDVPATKAGQWVQSLNGGYPRGTTMLTFSESREFVTRTHTAKPLAGYLRWYPKGTHWYCNVGKGTTKIRPLTGEVWADYYIHNRGEADDPIKIWTLTAPGERHVTMVDETLQPGFSDYNWDGAFSGDGDYGRFLEIEAGSTSDWIVVFYAHSLGPERLGWQVS